MIRAMGLFGKGIKNHERPVHAPIAGTSITPILRQETTREGAVEKWPKEHRQAAQTGLLTDLEGIPTHVQRPRELIASIKA
jgi:hypothetical protein